MKVLSKFVMIFLITISLGKVALAQGETAVPFLLLAPDSRSGGVGETGGGLADDATAIFWNPAGLAFLTGSEISFTHSNWLPQFQLDDLYYEYVAYRQYMESLDGSISGSISFMNYGEFIRTGSDGTELGKFSSYDVAATVGYATKISSDWGLGFNFRVIHSKLSDQPTEEEKGTGTATTVSFDVAAMWRPEVLDLPLIGDIGNQLSIGMNLSNIGPKITYIDQDQADPIPTNFRLGFAYKVFQDEYNSLTATLDFSKLLVDRGSGDSTKVEEKDEFYKAIFTAWADDPMSEELKDVVTSFGLEYWYGDPNDFLFALRTGFFYEDPDYGNRKFLTFGAGLRYDMYGFDFSYITTSVFKNGENHPLSETLRFTIMIGWGGSEAKTHGFPRGI
ncbi:MAG: type IX secretion system outer membrane channel protein PorV [Melioribacteraceae bacterium]|nr:type IX secretion system outer membrane channel protein PorV [Melioribacteraceae bacterium]